MERDDSGARIIRGHGSVFGVFSEDLGGFREMIHEGAFDDVLADQSLDCVCLVNHDDNLLLGRNTSGTLKLGTDAKGLTYECTLPETSYANDLAVSMDRGDITQSSFAFTVDWTDSRTEDNPEGAYEERFVGGAWELHIFRVSGLYDVSPVTRPAYREADVRSAAAVIERAESRRTAIHEPNADVASTVAPITQSDFQAMVDTAMEHAERKVEQAEKHRENLNALQARQQADDRLTKDSQTLLNQTRLAAKPEHRRVA